MNQIAHVSVRSLEDFTRPADVTHSVCYTETVVLKPREEHVTQLPP